MRTGTGTYLPVDNLVAWLIGCNYLIVNRREVRSSGISESLLMADGEISGIPALTLLIHYTTKDV